MENVLEWSDELSVSVSSCDRQHQRWIGFINDMHRAMAAGNSKNALLETLDKMSFYAKEHFTHEERLMQKTLYPGYLGHKAAHEEFAKKIEEMRAQGEQLSSVYVMNTIRDWLKTHIMSMDKKYGSHLNARGVL